MLQPLKSVQFCPCSWFTDDSPGICQNLVSGFVKADLKQPWASQMVLVIRNPLANVGDIRDEGSIPGLGRSLEESMATHSSILAWRIPWTEEPGGLQSTGSQRVRHDWSNFALMHTVKSTGINLDFPLASEIQGGVVGTFNLQLVDQKDSSLGLKLAFEVCRGTGDSLIGLSP